jgi:aminopeptidase
VQAVPDLPDPRTVLLDKAARVLVQSVLRVEAQELVAVVTDAESFVMAQAIARATDAQGAWVKQIALDALPNMTPGPLRPHRGLPGALRSALEVVDASVFVARALYAELPMRQALLHEVRERRIRHAHMPGLSLRGFTHGMRVDYGEVARAGNAILARLERAREVVTESETGTKLRVTLLPGRRWYAQLGQLAPGRWGNLPAGALCATPIDANGIFVADASLGEFFGEREGALSDKPARFMIEQSRVVRVEVPKAPALERDITAMLAVAPNSRRIGLVTVGVNAGIDAPSGEAIVDQNAPGLHVAIGDPAAFTTGADWSAPTCFGACQARASVWIDGVLVVDGGKLVAM